MKIKRSVLKKILRSVFFGLKSVDNKVKKMKNMFKKGIKKGIKKFSKSIIREYESQLEKIGFKSDLVVYSKEQLKFYLDDGYGDLVEIEYDEVLKLISGESKKIKKSIERSTKDLLVDEYSDGKKFLIDNMIKSVYFKAKKLVVTINGILLRVNEEYRLSIDKFLKIRNTIREKSYQMVKQNRFLLQFVIDNNIDNDKDFDSCLDILTKMYISEKEEDLYNNLSKFSREMMDTNFAF